MNQKAQQLARRLQAFSDEVIGFVKSASAEDWGKVCAGEDWTVGVTARHIGAGHFQAVGLARMIVAGEKLPDWTMAQIVAMANEHAREHGSCTPEEVLEVVRRSGAELVNYVKGLTDAELDRTGYLAAVGSKISAQGLIEAVILDSGGEHLASMKAALK